MKRVTIDTHPHHTPGRHHIPVVPDPFHASPADIDTQSHPELWWTPSTSDIARAVGWWWVPITLSAAALLVGTFAAFSSPALLVTWPLQLKLALFAAAVTLTVVVSRIRRIVRRRLDHFCIHCGYSLDALPDASTCPECGRPYTRALIAEYRKDPVFFRQRWREISRAPHTHKPLDTAPSDPA